MAFVEDQEHADGKEAAHEEIAEECVVIVGDRGRQIGLAEKGACEQKKREEDAEHAQRLTDAVEAGNDFFGVRINHQNHHLAKCRHSTQGTQACKALGLRERVIPPICSLTAARRGPNPKPTEPDQRAAGPFFVAWTI